MSARIVGFLLFLATSFANVATAEIPLCPGKPFMSHGIFLCYPTTYKAKYEGVIPDECFKEAEENGSSRCVLAENAIPIPWSVSFSENISRDVLEITIEGSSTVVKRISEEEVRSNWGYWLLCLIIATTGMVVGEMGSPHPNPKGAFPAYLGAMGCWMGLIYGFILGGLLLTILGILLCPKQIKPPLPRIGR